MRAGPGNRAMAATWELRVWVPRATSAVSGADETLGGCRQSGPNKTMSRGFRPAASGHMQPRMAMNVAQHKIVDSLKT